MKHFVTAGRATRRSAGARCTGQGTRYAAYGACRVRQDLATGGQDVRLHHRRAPGPRRRPPGHSRSAESAADIGCVDRQHHTELQGGQRERSPSRLVMRAVLMRGIVARAWPGPELVVLRGRAVLAAAFHRGAGLSVKCSACPVRRWAGGPAPARRNDRSGQAVHPGVPSRRV